MTQDYKSYSESGYRNKSVIGEAVQSYDSSSQDSEESEEQSDLDEDSYSGKVSDSDEDMESLIEQINL